MTLPTVPTKALTKNPKRLLLFGHSKIGKTTLLSDLPNNLILDLEDGSDFIDGMKVNVQQIALRENKPIITVLKEISDTLKSSAHKYDYISLDTTTGIEDVAKDLATIMYKQTAIGKNFKGKDVTTELPNGAGYGWLRLAFEKIYEYFDGIPTKALILTGHVKNSSIQKEGKDLGTRDLYLTGKLKNIICQQMDAIGYLYRSKDNSNQVIVSFKTDETDLATGARPEHLRQQEFVLSERNADGSFTFHWDKIFLPNN